MRQTLLYPTEGSLKLNGMEFHGIPQRYIPLLFAIFIYNLFFVIKTSEICNFAENNILHSCRTNLATVLESLEHDASIGWY